MLEEGDPVSPSGPEAGRVPRESGELEPFPGRGHLSPGSSASEKPKKRSFLLDQWFSNGGTNTLGI